MAALDAFPTHRFRIHSNRRSHFESFALAFTLLLVLSLDHRWTAIQQFSYPLLRTTYNPETPEAATRRWLDFYGASMLSGVKSDILFAAAGAILFMLLPRWCKVAGVLGLGVFFASNLQHIGFNFANIDLTTLGYAFCRSP